MAKIKYNQIQDPSTLDEKSSAVTGDWFLLGDSQDGFKVKRLNSLNLPGGANELNELIDVSTSTPTDKNVLVANGTSWVSRPLTEADISDLRTYLLPGDNISVLNNNSGFITLGDIPAFVPGSYDLTQFTNTNANPFARISDIQTTLDSYNESGTLAGNDSIVVIGDYDYNINSGSGLYYNQGGDFTITSNNLLFQTLNGIVFNSGGEESTLKADLLTQSRTHQVPDKNGTLALLSDITDGGFGNMLKSVYDTNNSGIVDNAELVNGLTVQTAVPAGALFTDTIFTPTSLLVDYSFTDNSSNWNTAYSWGDHSIVGYSTQTLVQGSNIDITNNVISATDTTYTAGNNVEINGGVISADISIIDGGNAFSVDTIEETIDGGNAYS